MLAAAVVCRLPALRASLPWPSPHPGAGATRCPRCVPPLPRSRAHAPHNLMLLLWPRRPRTSALPVLLLTRVGPSPKTSIAQHRHDDPTNTPDTPFDFTEENYKTVERILAKYPDNYKQVRARVAPVMIGWPCSSAFVRPGVFPAAPP